MKWLKITGIKSLYNVLDNVNLDDGVSVVASCGHGILKPNIVLIGYKKDWFNCSDEDIETYLNTLKYIIIELKNKNVQRNFDMFYYTLYCLKYSVANTNGLATIIVRLPSAANLSMTATDDVEDEQSGSNKKIRFYENAKFRSKLINSEEDITQPE